MGYYLATSRYTDQECRLCKKSIEKDQRVYLYGDGASKAEHALCVEEVNEKNANAINGFANQVFGELKRNKLV